MYLDDLYLDHNFDLGTVYVTTKNHTRSTEKQEELSQVYLRWTEVQELLKIENEKFHQHYAENEEKVRKSQETVRKYMEHKSSALLYIASYLEDIVRRQMPTATAEETQKTVAEFIFEIYLRRMLLSPRAIFRAAGHEVKEEAAMKLDSVVQFIGYAIANRGYGNSKWFLTSLNRQIHTIYEEFRAFITGQLSSVRLDDVYGMNEFTQFDPSHRPTLTLIDRQVAAIVKYLKLNAPVIVPGTGSSMHHLISKCSLPENSGDRSILLHLHPTERDENGGHNGEQLFVRMKKYAVDLLLSGCEGSTIPELLDFEPQPVHDEIHNNYYNPEKMPSLLAKQKELRLGLEELSQSGRIKDTEQYQDIVTDIANDIRLATRRRKEKSEQQESLQETEKVLKAQREELKTRLTQYEEYLDTCLENLSRTSRRLSFRPDTKAAGKIEKERKSLDVMRTEKKSAEKLFRKGILINLEVQGYETPKKQAKLQVEIGTTDKKGIFRLALYDGKLKVKETFIDFQDLLRGEANGDERYEMAGGNVVCDLPLTIQYINKKFYSK